jgi:hypothetical protein
VQRQYILTTARCICIALALQLEQLYQLHQLPGQLYQLLLLAVSTSKHPLQALHTQLPRLAL